MHLPPDTDNALILQKLDSLALDNAALRARLAAAFVESSVADLAALVAALASGDQPAAQRLSHRLKGACATLGAEGLAARLALMERGLHLSPEDVEAVSARLRAVHALLANDASRVPS